VPVTTVGELELVVLVAGGRLADDNRVAPGRTRVPEQAQVREDALRLVVLDVGREHVLDVALLVEEEKDAEEAERVPLVGVRDDLGDGDEARGGECRCSPPDHARDERDQRKSVAEALVSTHRSPKRASTWSGAETIACGSSRWRCGSLTSARGALEPQRRSNS